MSSLPLAMITHAPCDLPWSAERMHLYFLYEAKGMGLGIVRNWGTLKEVLWTLR